MVHVIVRDDYTPSIYFDLVAKPQTYFEVMVIYADLTSNILHFLNAQIIVVHRFTYSGLNKFLKILQLYINLQILTIIRLD